jgi:prephenate dehydrogenase
MKKTVAIIGVGLIGGSLGMALRLKRRRYRVIGLGRNLAKLKKAKRFGAVDGFTTDWAAGASDADIVVVCTPVDLIAPSVKKILPYLKPGAVVTDAGSVKGSVVKEVDALGKVTFVGSHPMTGLEKSGVDFATPVLYKDATVVLTPERKSAKRAVKAVRMMWADAGAKIITLDADRHDAVAALTSHLPHVIAFSLALAVSKLNKKKPVAAKMLAGSFRDITRVADSNPSDWAGICSANSKEVSNAIDVFIKELRSAKKHISDKRKTERLFAEARSARRKLLNP